MNDMQIAEALGRFPTGNLCNAHQDVRAMHSSIAPLFHGAKICGPAKTAKILPGQTLQFIVPFTPPGVEMFWSSTAPVTNTLDRLVTSSPHAAVARESQAWSSTARYAIPKKFDKCSFRSTA